jgi:hypothetical protein
MTLLLIIGWFAVIVLSLLATEKFLEKTDLL